MKVAALITSYNRCDMTLNSVSCLYRQSIETDIYIVDGGSSDYTVSKIKAQYKDVNIKVIDGLYWAGGMREAWKWAANEEQYDYYLLLNDDTTLYDNALDLLLADAEKGLEIYKMPVIVVGTTIDNVTKQFSYGGRRLIAKGKSTSTIVYPNADCLEECELGNANIMLVPAEIYNKIGGLSDKYTHGIADYDYTLRAVEAGFHCVVCSEVCGECVDNHGNNWLSSKKSTLKERITYLYSPKGLAYKEYLYYIKRFFPKEYCSAKLKLWLKTLFPFLWEMKKQNSQNA